MTAANEFVPGEEGEVEGGMALFGLSLTPEIIGIAIGVVGLGLAGYFAFQLIMPELQKGNDIKDKIDAAQREQQDLDRKIKLRTEAENNLEKAKSQRGEVTAMFASDGSLNILLLDLNERVKEINAGIQGDLDKAKLLKFEPVLPSPPPGQANPKAVSVDKEALYVVNDSSFGSGVTGKLRRKMYRVEFEGTFEQTRNFFRKLERMQSLLVVKSLKTQLSTTGNSALDVEWQDGKIVPVGIQKPKLRTSFDLHALLPLKQPDPSPSTSPKGTQTPAPIPSPLAKP